MVVFFLYVEIHFSIIFRKEGLNFSNVSPTQVDTVIPMHMYVVTSVTWMAPIYIDDATQIHG